HAAASASWREMNIDSVFINMILNSIMRNHFWRVAALAVVLVWGRDARSVVPDAVDGGQRTMRVQDCVSLALRQNVDVLTADEEIQVAQAQRSGTRGRFAPKVQI